MELARSYLDNWDQYAEKEKISNELGFDFAARQTQRDGLPVTIVKAKIDGMTVEQHEHFNQNRQTMIPLIEDKVAGYLP